MPWHAHACTHRDRQTDRHACAHVDTHTHLKTGDDKLNGSQRNVAGEKRGLAKDIGQLTLRV